jgi:hypothetical protein
MSLSPYPIQFRLRDATGFYLCSLPTVRSICSGIDWSRRLQSATRSHGCLIENLRDPYATDQYHPCPIRGNGSRFCPRLFQTLTGTFATVKRPARSDSRAPRRDLPVTTSPTKKFRTWSADPRGPVSALVPIGCGQTGDLRPRTRLNYARNLDPRSGFTGRPTYLTREATASNLPSARSTTQRSG